jgi:uncharacterized protein (DUF1501 family)
MSKYFPTAHRPKGAIGKSHATARHAIVEVYKLNGGVQGLWNWMRKSDANESAFYTVLLPKLIPAEIADQHGISDTKIQVVILPAQSTVTTNPALHAPNDKPLDGNDVGQNP